MSTRPSKRVMGRGRIYRRANGTWAGEITVDGRRSTAYAPTHAECVDKLQALQATVAGGLPAVDQRGTLGKYLAQWWRRSGPSSGPRRWPGTRGSWRARSSPSWAG